MWPPRPSQSAPAKSQRGPRPGAIPRPPLRPGALALGVVGRPGCQEERGSSSGGSLQAPFKATVSRRGWTSWIALVERLDRHAPDPTPARRRPSHHPLSREPRIRPPGSRGRNEFGAGGARRRMKKKRRNLQLVGLRSVGYPRILLALSGVSNAPHKPVAIAAAIESANDRAHLSRLRAAAASLLTFRSFVRAPDAHYTFGRRV